MLGIMLLLATLMVQAYATGMLPIEMVVLKENVVRLHTSQGRVTKFQVDAFESTPSFVRLIMSICLHMSLIENWSFKGLHHIEYSDLGYNRIHCLITYLFMNLTDL